MKVDEILPVLSKKEALKKLRAKIMSKRKNSIENEPNLGWNQGPHQGNVPGAKLYR